MRISRTIILFAILNVFALLLHLWTMGSTFTLSTLSDIYFVVGIITFLPAVVAQTKAYVVFQGINYSLRALFARNFKTQYPNFRDYKEVKDTDIKTSFFTELLLSSGLIMMIGIVLSVVVMNG